MSISRKIEGFIEQASLIRKMFEDGLELKKKYGEGNVYDFSLGNPNLPPPREFQESLEQVVSENIPGKHTYMPNAGYPETRARVAENLSSEYGIKFDFEHVIMTCGAGGALNVIFKTILDPEDEVITPIPCFVEYFFYVDNAGGKIKFVPTKDDFSLDIETIEKEVTAKTKAILINSPNNPTGKVYDASSLRELTDMLKEKSQKLGKIIYLISDEPYREIVYGGIKVPSLFQIYPHTIVASSYSKSLSLAGERIGYIAIHPEIAGVQKLLAGLVLCNRMLGFVNAPALMQRVIARIPGAKVDINAYKRKRDLLCDGLSRVGYTVQKPEGAFYLFLKTPTSDDDAFAKSLQRRRILTVPGRAFMKSGYIRIAYCVPDETIERSIEGFGETLREFTS
ncbi:MAG: pyridoxal phosphate-dependent aminotransferase [Syntrophales bacterium]|nr:pyridoxal phosphate-dependent aminotransferase [Syntrophales bacterium]